MAEKGLALDTYKEKEKRNLPKAAGSSMWIRQCQQRDLIDRKRWKLGSKKWHQPKRSHKTHHKAETYGNE